MGMSLRAMAASIGCSAPALSRWERGLRTPRAYWLHRIERIMGYGAGGLSRHLSRPRKELAWTDGSAMAAPGTRTR